MVISRLGPGEPNQPRSCRSRIISRMAMKGGFPRGAPESVAREFSHGLQDFCNRRRATYYATASRSGKAATGLPVSLITRESCQRIIICIREMGGRLAVRICHINIGAMALDCTDYSRRLIRAAHSQKRAVGIHVQCHTRLVQRPRPGKGYEQTSIARTKHNPAPIAGTNVKVRRPNSRRIPRRHPCCHPQLNSPDRPSRSPLTIWASG